MVHVHTRPLCQLHGCHGLKNHGCHPPTGKHWMFRQSDSSPDFPGKAPSVVEFHGAEAVLFAALAGYISWQLRRCESRDEKPLVDDI